MFRTKKKFALGFSSFILLSMFVITKFGDHYEMADQELVSEQHPMSSFMEHHYEMADQELVSEQHPMSSFMEHIGRYPWKDLMMARKRNDTAATIRLLGELLGYLTPFLVMEQKVPPNGSCTPKPLEPVTEETCSSFPTAFSGRQNKHPLKLGMFIMLGLDVDMLEVTLNDIYDMVNVIFIVEATRAHNVAQRKPLLWERIREQERFRKFKEKIVHLVLDDADMAWQRPASGWTSEYTMEAQGWKKLLRWNNATSMLRNCDIIGFASADEIVSRKNLQLIRNCEMRGPTLTIGSWFPYGKFGQAFASDHPVPGHKYTFGNPSFWKFGYAIQHTNSRPSRLYGKSKWYLLGGIHMSHHGYLPYLIGKFITCTSCQGNWNSQNDVYNSFYKWIQSEDLLNWEIQASTCPTYFVANKRIRPIQELRARDVRGILYIPWYVECNPLRYPTWYGSSHDTRLD